MVMRSDWGHAEVLRAHATTKQMAAMLAAARHCRAPSGVFARWARFFIQDSPLASVLRIRPAPTRGVREQAYRSDFTANFLSFVPTVVSGRVSPK
jgi:hypothetical protein